MSGSDVQPVSPDELLHEALLDFTGCVGESIPDMCSYGLTVGETYTPFLPDDDDECEDDESVCSQLWVRVMSVSPTPGAIDGWDRTECGSLMQLDLEVGWLRCVDIPDGGEAPTSTNVTTGALQSMSDMIAVQCAALSCEVWDSINVGTWTPIGPLGDQYGGVWTFTVVV